MAKGINKVTILGRVGKDPEVRSTQGGVAITNISVATSESWTDKQTGQKTEKTEWHKVVFFNRLAEVVRDYIKKGSMIYLEGKLTTEKYTDKQGIEKYTTKIIGSEMQMLDGKPQQPKSSEPTYTKSGHRLDKQDEFQDDEINF